METSNLPNIINDPTFETLQITQMPDLKERDHIVSQRWPVKGALSRTYGPHTETFLEMETKSTQLPRKNNCQ